MTYIFLNEKFLPRLNHLIFSTKLLLLIFLSKPAFAGYFNFTEDTTVNNSVTNNSYLFGGDNLTFTVGSSGSIDGIDVDRGLYSIGITDVDGWMLNNRGSINSSFGGSIHIENSSGQLSLESGSIIANEDADFKSPINITGISNVSIINSTGSIISNEVTNNESDPISKEVSGILVNDNANVNISNAGAIYGGSAIYSKSSGTIILNNTGNIYTTFGDVLYYEGTSSEALDIRYAFKGSSGTTKITNSGTMTGTIDLGTNASSFVTINDGNVTGNILLGNSSQEVNLNGGEYEGNIDGTTGRAGIVNIGSNFTLNSLSSLGSTNGIDTINIINGSNTTLEGSSNASTINVNSGAVLNLASSTMSANTTNVSGIMNFGNVDRTYSSNISGTGTGIIDLGSGSHRILSGSSINGDLNITSGDTLSVNVSGSSAGNISTDGTASVSSNSIVNVVSNTSSGYLEDFNVKILDSATGTSVNAVDNISYNGSSFTILNLSTEVRDTNDLYLVLSGRMSAESATLSPNAQNVYRDVNMIGSSSSGELLAFQKALDGASSSDQLTEILKTSTPQSDDGVRQTSINQFKNTNQAIEGRLDEIRRRSMYRIVKGKSYKNTKSERNSIRPTATAEKVRIWTQGYNINSNQSNKAGHDGEGYNAKGTGFIVGADKKVSNNTHAGATIEYSDNNVISNDRSKETDMRSVKVSTYFSHIMGKYFFDNILSASFNQYDTKRIINSVNASANANYSSNSYMARVRGGTTRHLGGNFNLTPEIGLTYIHDQDAKYAENGAGTMNLNVKRGGFDFLEIGTGINIGYQGITKGGTLFRPELKVLYGYDLIDQRGQSISSFSGQSSSFITTHTKYDPSSLKIIGSFQIEKIDLLSLNAEYGLEIKKYYTSNFISLRGVYKF
jgi:uncharacterized protein with beta-barrel porin domain